MIDRQIIDASRGLQQYSTYFFAHTLIIDNPTNQWLYEPSSHRFIPPYFGGIVIGLPGTQAVTIANQAPIGLIQAPLIAGQEASISFWDGTLVDAPGIPLVSARAQSIDRNPLTIAKWFSLNSIGPHTQTVRFSYTVPRARLFQLEGLQTQVTRQGVANPPGTMAAFIAYTPFGQAQANAFQAIVLKNNVGDQASVNIGSTQILTAGDNILGVTSDNSTGGLGEYDLSIIGTEFDA